MEVVGIVYIFRRIPVLGNILNLPYIGSVRTFLL